MEFIVYGKPQGKQRARTVRRGNFVTSYTPKETVNYETLIKMSFRDTVNQLGNPFFEEFEPLELTIKAVCPIPKSFSKKKHAQAVSLELRPTTKPDLDNIIKVVCDALNGVAYRDDTQIVYVYASKCYGIEPRLEIGIHRLRRQDETFITRRNKWQKKDITG